MKKVKDLQYCLQHQCILAEFVTLRLVILTHQSSFYDDSLRNRIFKRKVTCVFALKFAYTGPD